MAAGAGVKEKTGRLLNRRASFVFAKISNVNGVKNVEFTMSTYALLTLDLNNLKTNAQRDDAYAKLEELLWVKVPKVTTLWKASFKDDVTDEQIRQITRQDVAAAATAGRITEYEATMAICKAPPETWKSA